MYTNCLEPGENDKDLTGVLVVPYRGKNEVLVALRVFRLKWSRAGTFAMLFRILSRKKMTGSVM